MKEFLSKKSVGFYLGCATALMSLVGLIVYATAINSVGPALAMFIVAVVAEIACIGLSVFFDRDEINLLAIAVAVLIAIGIIIGFFYQVEQIGWCISGLDPFGVLASFFVSVAFNVIALITATTACFFRQNKADLK